MWMTSGFHSRAACVNADQVVENRYSMPLRNSVACWPLRPSPITSTSPVSRRDSIVSVKVRQRSRASLGKQSISGGITTATRIVGVSVIELIGVPLAWSTVLARPPGCGRPGDEPSGVLLRPVPNASS